MSFIIPQALRTPLDISKDSLIALLLSDTAFSSLPLDEKITIITGLAEMQESMSDPSSKVFPGKLTAVETVEIKGSNSFVLGTKAIIHFIGKNMAGAEENQTIRTDFISLNVDPHSVGTTHYSVMLAQQLVDIAQNNIGQNVLMRKCKTTLAKPNKHGGDSVKFLADIIPPHTKKSALSQVLSHMRGQGAEIDDEIVSIIKEILDSANTNGYGYEETIPTDWKWSNEGSTNEERLGNTILLNLFD